MQLESLTPSPGALELSAVERGADGLPVAWKLLGSGDNFLTLNGVPHNLRLEPPDLEKIVE